MNLTHLVGTLEISRNCSRVRRVHRKLHLTPKLLILEYFVIKNIKHFRTYPGEIWGTLGTSWNYSRLVHLGSQLHL